MKLNNSNNSGKIFIGLLAVIVLAAASGGLLSSLHAAGTAPNPNPRINSGTVASFGNLGVVLISENGDGTAFVSVQGLLADGSFVAAFSFAAPTYSVATTVHPGQSGHGTGSGTGHVDITGTHFASDGTPIGDVLLHADVTVTNATNVIATVNSGIQVQTDPITGQTAATRFNRHGNSAYSDTAGTYSISAEGAGDAAETGVFGEVDEFSINSRTRIR